MTDTTARLPDLLLRTTALGNRFGWRLVTMEGKYHLTSGRLAEQDGTPADYATRAEARVAGTAVLMDLVRSQPAVATEGEVVDMRFLMGPPRLVA